jgi:hypothetical protein
MILALVDHITPRYRYIFDFLFKDILGHSIVLTTDRQEFSTSDYPKFCYSDKPEGDPITFYPEGLLSEQGLRPTSWDSSPGQGTSSPDRELHPFEQIRKLGSCFPVKKGASLPYDPFSAAFFILTRMEEYLPFEPDAHGRFTEKQSIQYKLGLLHEPVVNQLAFTVLEVLQKKYPELTPQVSYSFLPTIDVDIAFAHLGKEPLRALGGYAKLLMKGDLDSLKERWRVVNGQLPDPYNNFDLHLELAKQYGTGLIYFFLLGDYGKYDKMISYKNKLFRDLIRRLSEQTETGIHPSYDSYGNFSQVKKEKERLEGITGKSVDQHRAHFLRLKFPDTFRDLNALGIKEDYSLGYSAHNGFRAGTANPFFFYDVLKDELTNLRIHPFTFMDSTMIDNMKISPEEGEKQIMLLLNKVRNYGGEAIGIWHNYSLCEKGQYRGWQQVFRNVMKKVTSEKL